MEILPTKKTPESQYGRGSRPFLEIAKADATPPPPDIIEIHMRDLGLAEINKDRYTSPAFHRLELDRMWSKVWQFVCLRDDIPEVGDIATYEIGDDSFIIAHVADGKLKAYYNSCTHRGVKLCSGITSLSEIKCPFHGFTWNLDGSLKYVPCRWDFPQVTDEGYALREVLVDSWGQFVFINLDPNAMPLLEYMEIIPEQFTGFCDQENKYVHARYRKVLPCNWKAGIEAFLEAYHSQETHPQSLPYACEGNAQYDILPDGRHTSRMMQSIGEQSCNLANPITQQDMADALFGGMGGDIPQLEADQTLRTVLADATRAALSSACGRDYSACSEVELIDSMQYFLFPNIILFRGYVFPVGYRFRPNGHDPDTCIMDFMIFQDLPEGAERPELPDVVDMGDKSFGEALVGLNEELRLIYDQDIQNMALQQAGFKVGGKTTVTLSQYQEVRIRHLHQTLDYYINMLPMDNE